MIKIDLENYYINASTIKVTFRDGDVLTGKVDSFDPRTNNGIDDFLNITPMSGSLEGLNIGFYANEVESIEILD